MGLLNSERLLVTSAKGLAEVCSRTYDFPKPEFIQLLAGKILGPGLVLVNGDEHKRQRKMLTPVFTAKNVKELYPLFWAKSKELAQRISESVFSPAVTDVSKLASKGSGCIDISDWASRAALDVITVSALGRDWGSIANPDGELCRTYHSLFQLGQAATMIALIKSFVPEWIVRLIPLANKSGMDSAADTVKSTCREVVREKMAKLEKGQLTDVDLLSVLLRGGEIKEDEAVYQMMTFLAAGHETLATAVTWTIYQLCVYPEWQGRLRKEIREGLPKLDDDETITNRDIDDLVELNAFCHETLRWWPPIPSTLRTTARNTTLLGQYVPKGTRLVLPMRGSNRNAEIWGYTADTFSPERWIQEGPKFDASGGASSKYGMLTFMHGMRNCIGQSFAKAEMACIVATLVGRFEFELQNPLELDEKNIKISKGGVTARPADGLLVKMKLVEGW